jgi:Ca2+-binding EF-hand superfamily protein
MKRLGLVPQFLAATLFLAPGLRAVEETKLAEKPAASPPPAPAMKTSRADELLKRFDLTHDGKLDEDELAAAHEVMLKEQMDRQAATAAAPAAAEFRARMLAMFDKNHDGRLDDDERAEMRKYAEERGLGENGEVREELMRRFDKNADGKLDDVERAEMQKFLLERRSQGAANLREFLLREFDRNADGKIDDAEMAELEKTMRPRLAANPQQLQRYDKNGDGKIDDIEWAAARKQILHLVNSPAPAQPDSQPAVPAEQAKLDAVAKEVAQRQAERLQREAAAKDGGK